MKPQTVLRAAAWIGVVLVGWSLNIRWGDDPNLPPGPPATYQRHVVGALLLGMVAAVSLFFAGRPGTGGWIARGLACAAAFGAAAIALVVRSRAPASVLGGPGWMWMMGGAAVLAGTCAAGLMLAPRAKRTPARRGR